MTGRERCMIFRNDRSTCTNCGMTELYCQAVRDMERRTCCGAGCSHGS